MNLFAAYLGGPPGEGRMGEDHEVVFVVADTPQDAKTRAKMKWTGMGRGHVDAVQRLQMVDGYEVDLTLVGEGDETELSSYN
jgi:hypothetical protein